MPSDASVLIPAQPAGLQRAAHGGVVGRARALLARRLHVLRKLAVNALLAAAGISREPEAPFAAHAPGPALRGLGGAYARIKRAWKIAELLRERLRGILESLDGGDVAGADRALRDAGLPGLSEDCEDCEDLEEVDSEDSDEEELEEAEKVERVERVESLDRLGDLFGFTGPDEPPAEDLRRYVMSRPVDELITEVREALGLTPDWLREIEAEWERGQAEAPPSTAPTPTGRMPPTAGARPPLPRGASPAAGQGHRPTPPGRARPP